MNHRIKDLIKERGYTQQEFADKLGITRVGLSQLINGKPSYSTLEKISAALEVPCGNSLPLPKKSQERGNSPPSSNTKGHFTKLPR